VFYDAEVALTGDEDADPADYDKSVTILFNLNIQTF